jgi:Na+/phosphate symporter
VSQNIKQAPAKFSAIRFAIFCGLAWLIFRTSGGSDSYGAQFIGIGMLFLAFFAAVFDPFSSTDSKFKPQNSLEWASLAAALIGMGLFAVGLYAKLA